MLTLLTLLVALLVAGPAPQAPAPAPAAAAVEARTGSKIWLGHEREFEDFLISARIVRTEHIPVGVTRPVHAFFEPGGMAAGAVFKPLSPGMHDGYFDSYKNEIAAYELDKMLGLGMVPPTVERAFDGQNGSVQLWVEGCHLLKSVNPATAPDIAAWNRQVYRQRVWDNLIGNMDRNQGNLLVDAAWNLILIDHSRAFASTRTMPFQMTHIDRELYEKLRALTADDLRAHLGKLLFDGPKPLLARRDLIVKHFDELVKKNGEAAVFVR